MLTEKRPDTFTNDEPPVIGQLNSTRFVVVFNVAVGTPSTGHSGVSPLSVSIMLGTSQKMTPTVSGFCADRPKTYRAKTKRKVSFFIGL
jgi:hypothetical protein